MPTVRDPLPGLGSPESLAVGTVAGPSATGDFSSGTSDFALVFDASEGAWEIRQKNEAKLTFGSFTELLTILDSAFTDTSSTIPANAIIFAITVRVVTTIPDASEFSITTAVGGNGFNVGGGVSTSAGTTNTGNHNCPKAPDATVAQSVRITPNVTPTSATGEVRVVAWWCVSTPATS